MSKYNPRQSLPGGSSAGAVVRSVVRAFDVLEVLARAEQELQVAEIAATTGLASPTAHRLLKTLCALGYVYQAETRGYRLGSGLIYLGKRAAPQLATIAQGILTELEDFSEETANLAVLDGDLITYIAQTPSRHHMRMFTEVGRRVLPHAAGVGKATLSTLPDEQVLEIIRRTGLPAYTASTLTSEQALLADLHETRRRGFAIDDGEQEVGVRCIAVPIPGSLPPAAVSISGPAARITDQKSPELIDSLQQAAKRLSL